MQAFEILTFFLVKTVHSSELVQDEVLNLSYSFMLGSTENSAVLNLNS
jgi:hypothetical protein